jgi:integrase
MPKMQLNARKVESLLPGNMRTQIFDKNQPNLALRIGASGVKTWSVVYKWHGRMKRFTIGTYPAVSLADARSRAREALRDVSRGDDPQEQKMITREAGTFGELAAQYIREWSQATKKSWVEDQRQLDVYLLPAWKHVKASAVTIDDVELLLETLASRAPVQANRVRALLRHMYSWALSKRTHRKKFALEHSPCAFVARPAKERARERVYSDEELKAIWKAFGTIGIVGDVFRLQLLTAVRPGEAAGVEWRELDLERALWTQPGAKTKNGKVHVIPLSSPAVRIFEGLQQHQAGLKNPSKRNSRFVFCNPRNPDIPIAWLQKAGERVRDESKVQDFRPHDLRRTCATRLAEMGVPDAVLKMILNHSLGSDITGVYNQYKYFEERKQALDAWAERLLMIVSDLKAVGASPLARRDLPQHDNSALDTDVIHSIA